jgi:hypothetical protein
MRAYGAVEAGERGSSEVVASRRARVRHPLLNFLEQLLMIGFLFVLT